MTSKELAKQLGLSETAVSFALNDKPGVSEKTRRRVKEAAIAGGMRLPEEKSAGQSRDKIIYLFTFYRNPIYTPTDFFTSTENGIQQAAAEKGYQINSVNVMGHENLENEIRRLQRIRPCGLIVFGYLLTWEDFSLFSFCSYPVIVMDNRFQTSKIDFVQINNVDMAYLATNYLINKRSVQPGYLRSSLRTFDFEERALGFRNALAYNLMHRSRSVVHDINPRSIEDAQADMLEILDNHETLAQSYFADNDIIAIGAIRAMRMRGLRVPEDVSVIGFDDITVASYIEPSLTTIHIPRFYMGQICFQRLLQAIEEPEHHPVSIIINGYLVARQSVAPLDLPSRQFDVMPQDDRKQSTEAAPAAGADTGGQH